MDVVDACTLADSLEEGDRIIWKAGYSKVLKVMWVKRVEKELESRVIERNGVPAREIKFQKARFVFTNEKPGSPKKLARSERHGFSLTWKELVLAIKNQTVIIFPEPLQDRELLPVEYNLEYDASG